MIENNIDIYIYVCFSNHALVVHKIVVERYIYILKTYIAGIVGAGGVETRWWFGDLFFSTVGPLFFIN